MTFDRRSATTWDFLATASDQELFNHVCEALAAQGFRAAVIPDSETCVYRVPGSADCCAFGHLIPDALYDPAWDAEMRGVEWIIQQQSALATLPRDRVRLIGELQRAHDLGLTPEEMKRELRALASRYLLTAPAVLA